MIFAASTDPHAIAKAVAKALGRGWAVVDGEIDGGVGIGWEAPASVAVMSHDVDLARGLSAALGARVVFAMSFPGSFAAELVVFDKGKRTRGIHTDDEGTKADGKPYPFEDDVFDDAEDLAIDESTVEDYCEHLGIQIHPRAKIAYSVVTKPAKAKAAKSVKPAKAKAAKPVKPVKSAKPRR